MKIFSRISILVLIFFLNACGTQATPDVNSIALTVAGIVWTAAAQTMEAIPTSTPYPTGTPVPAPTIDPTPLTIFINYTIVEPNETCIMLAERFGISAFSIRFLNGGDICRDVSKPLPVGLIIKIPLQTPTIPPPT